MNAPERRLLPNAADKASLKAIATTVVQTCPSLLDAAREVASELLTDKGLSGNDPDHVYFHRFRTAQSSALTFTGWEHTLEKPYESLTLTQLVIHRFRVTDQDNADLLGLYGGFYTDGPQAESFNQSNEVKLLGSDVLKAFWNIDFSTHYTHQLTTFWQNSADNFRTLAKCSFLSLAVNALQKGHLDGTDFQRVINSVCGPVTWPVTLQMLQSSYPVGSEVRALDIDGHIAVNILRFVEDSGRQTLYLPGEAQAFKVLENEAALHWWVLEQLNDETRCKIFLNHFSFADRHAINQNFTDLMNRLVSTWGHSDHYLINKTNLEIGRDAFTWLRICARHSMSEEVSLLLTSNAELRKKLWIGYLSAGLKVFGPMATVGWPLALPVIGAGIANMGLNIDRAVNGRTPAERRAGTLGAVLNGIEALFNVPFLIGTGAHLEVGPQVEFAEAQEMAGLIEFTSADEPFLPTQDQAQVVVADKDVVEMANDIASETPPTSPVVLAPTAPQTPSVPKVPARYLCNELLDRYSAETQSGKFQGIYRLDGEPPYAIDLDGKPYYVRYFDTSEDSGHWAIVDPERANQFVGSLPVRYSAAGRWERMLALRLNGGGQCLGTACYPYFEPSSSITSSHPPTPSTPSPELPLVEPVPATARPLRLVTTLYDVLGLDMARLRKWAMNLPDDSADAVREARRNLSVNDLYTLHFDHQRTLLLNEAREYYSALNWSNLPARPILPEVSHSMTTDALIDRIFEKTKGLVVGETLDRITSMRFMIENMPALARHATTLYVRDLLSDFAQSDLNSFHTSGQMSEDLRIYLTSLGTDPNESFNMLELVKSAQANGVRVQSLDCAASYKMKVPLTSIEEQMMRARMTSKIMWGDEILNRPDKWIALVDAQNTNNFRNLPGISELKGGIGLRIEEAFPGEDPGVSTDPGIKVARGPFDNGASTRDSFDYLHADLRLQIDAPPVTWTDETLDRLLHRNGMYLIEKSQGNYTLVRRNSTGSIVRTPVNRTLDGQAYLWLQSMPRISGVLFPDISALSQRLIEIGLKLQSRLPD
ncbi:membrane-targeted effector domain-containing toxin [Pseudomonas sp. NPDC087817]|uniref:membrane-targeted effector domain-containing toxin n=1 Tax=Pseudomonas sp. NPDC087817 TaxID=3364451 RepID=UPI0037F2691C